MDTNVFPSSLLNLCNPFSENPIFLRSLFSGSQSCLLTFCSSFLALSKNKLSALFHNLFDILEISSYQDDSFEVVVEVGIVFSFEATGEFGIVFSF